ncbi:MAG: nucleotidyl transferase [Candidatus Hydrogenedentota bacterium]|nr:MAG: nucleotidyl transferase [Candidatus Hydrogenedentota bacterium]
MRKKSGAATGKPSRRGPFPIDAILLAGGKGERLRSLLGKHQKVAAPIGDKPFFLHILRHLADQGVRRVVVAAGFRSVEIRAALVSYPPPLPVIVVVEKKPLGTAGAVRKALTKTRSDPVLIVNGDTWAEIPLASFFDYHTGVNSELTIAVRWKKHTTRFGRVECDRSGRILRFEEKGAKKSGHINAGWYLANRRVLQALPKLAPLSLETDVFPRLIGRALHAWRGRFRFLDIGTPGSFSKAQAFLRSR